MWPNGHLGVSGVEAPRATTDDGVNKKQTIGIKPLRFRNVLVVAEWYDVILTDTVKV